MKKWIIENGAIADFLTVPLAIVLTAAIIVLGIGMLRLLQFVLTGS